MNVFCYIEGSFSPIDNNSSHSSSLFFWCANLSTNTHHTHVTFRWARTTVHSSVVQAVYNAWEMERHHAAERHLFPEAISAIKQIQSDHPDVVVGAVTDGSANPMLMVFSLMPLFDFTVSWEDDIGNVKKMAQFRELSAINDSDEVSWIYQLAVEKGREMSKLADEIKRTSNADAAANDDDDETEWCWVHVGDDLAYDVGGSATTGAKTVLVELAPEYGQTARLRTEGIRPVWTTETEEQMSKHRKMSLNALDKVDARITHLSQLPEVINELLKAGDDDEFS
jgi:FMN phosphatase YigB (HAD superfamily)